MLTGRIEELWKTANSDGASCPVGPGAARSGAELQLILDAWSIERGRSVESSLLLDRSRSLLARVVAGKTISEKERRAARRLLRAIEQSDRE